MAYRTVSSVEEGVARKEYVDQSTVFLDYQPGNHTRYQVLITWLREGNTSADLRRSLGLGQHEGYVVSLLNNSCRTCVLPGYDRHVDWHYLGDKLGLSKGDAVVVAELVASQIGATCVSSADQLAMDRGETPGVGPSIAF